MFKKLAGMDCYDEDCLLKSAKRIYWTKSITLYLIHGSCSNSVEVRGSVIVTGGARLWRIDRGEIGREAARLEISSCKNLFIRVIYRGCSEFFIAPS